MKQKIKRYLHHAALLKVVHQGSSDTNRFSDELEIYVLGIRVFARYPKNCKLNLG